MHLLLELDNNCLFWMTLALSKKGEIIFERVKHFPFEMMVHF